MCESVLSENDEMFMEGRKIRRRICAILTVPSLSSISCRVVIAEVCGKCCVLLGLGLKSSGCSCRGGGRIREAHFVASRQLSEGYVSEVHQRLAAIDAGSNTIHLVVAEIGPDGHDIRTLGDELELVRLGADVSASGAIGAERAVRAIATIRAQAEQARTLGASTVLGIATEGVRAAANADEFLRRVEAETGVRLELVTGEQEAALTYWGVISGVEASNERRTVLDLGGGSLEIVAGKGSAITWRVSLPLGSGAIHDRYAPADPPVASELETARRVVAETLHPLDLAFPVDEALACGGTATTLAALAAWALTEANGTGGNGAGNGKGGFIQVLTQAGLGALLELLQSLPAVEVSRRYRVDEVRARLLGAGTVVLLATMDWLGVDALRVSRRGIREGALLAYLHTGERWLEAAALGEGW